MDYEQPPKLILPGKPPAPIVAWGFVRGPGGYTSLVITTSDGEIKLLLDPAAVTRMIDKIQAVTT